MYGFVLPFASSDFSARVCFSLQSSGSSHPTPPLGLRLTPWQCFRSLLAAQLLLPWAFARFRPSSTDGWMGAGIVISSVSCVAASLNHGRRLPWRQHWRTTGIYIPSLLSSPRIAFCRLREPNRKYPTSNTLNNYV